MAHVRKAKPIDLIAINSSNIGESYTVWRNLLEIVLAVLEEMGTDRSAAQTQSGCTLESVSNAAACQEAAVRFCLPREP